LEGSKFIVKYFQNCFGYQGQLKSQNDVNWDEFELRLFNHDLGRWSAPDPYGQFDSPYIGMGNNPVSSVDPDGGYTNASADGGFLNRLRASIEIDKLYHLGHYSYKNLYSNYKDELNQLFYKIFPSGSSSDGVGSLGIGQADDYLNAIYELNNKYLGLGAPADMLGSGIYDIGDVARNTVTDLVKRNIAQTTAEPQNDAITTNNNFDGLATNENAWINEMNQTARNYVDRWRSNPNRGKESKVKEAKDNNPNPDGSKTYINIDVGQIVRTIKKAFGLREANTKNRVIQLQKKVVTKERTVWKQIANAQNVTGVTNLPYSGTVDIDYWTTRGTPGVNVSIINGDGTPAVIMSGVMDATISGGDLGSSNNPTLNIVPFTPTVQYSYRVSKQFVESYEVYRLRLVNRYYDVSR
jgi:RHS repeat-associated protein